MATTKPEIAIVLCPKCGARFAVSSAMIGKRARCAACDTPFVVPSPTATSQMAIGMSTATPEIDADMPEYIGLDCRVCDTRMYGRPTEIGKQIKCPDCGALNVVPPPPKPKPKNIPAAMEGEQYELWEPDEQPLPAQIIATQPKYIAVKCSRCGTLMHATENQVGQQIACPDCRTKHVVPPPPKALPKQSVLAPDVEIPRIDPSARPAERPYIAAPLKRMLHEERQEAEYARALAKSQRTGKPMEIDSRGRPVLPRWPLVTGVLPFLFIPQVPVIVLALSIGYIASGIVFLLGLHMAMAGDLGAVAGMCLFALGCLMLMVCTAALSSCILQIAMESSEGNRRIENWPSMLDWFGSLAYTITAGMVSAIPGFAISQIPPFNLDASNATLFAAIGGIFCFPVVLLSQLDISSPWGILSARILTSLFRCPFSWVMFYLECALIVAVCAWPAYQLSRTNPNNTLWLAPLYLIGAILFARLLGRLAWRLAEAMPVESN